MSQNAIDQAGRQTKPAKATRPAENPNKFPRVKTQLPHVFLMDVDDSGLQKEIALVKEDADGTIHYIDIASLARIDQARIKKVVTSVHADKYPLWELLSQVKFSNGLNGLDFVHWNFVKVKRPKGARASSSSIMNVGNVSDSMIGGEFTNPAEAELDNATRTFR